VFRKPLSHMTHKKNEWRILVEKLKENGNSEELIVD